jgi:carbon monoxide dehydrogenase subunit G
MQIEERFNVAAPPAKVYGEMSDVGGIGDCIAGVKRVEVVSPDRSRWKIEVRAGFVAMNVELDAEIVERREPELLRFDANGQDVEISGRVEFAADGNGGTDCAVLIDAQIGGALGPLADRIARGPQEQLVAETVANIRARLEESAVGAAPADAPATASAPAPKAVADARSASRPSVALDLPGVPDAAMPLLLGGLLVVIGFLLGRRP